MNSVSSFVPLSNALLKKLCQLHDKKFRNEYKLFIVSGDKLVRELLVAGLKIDYIIAEAGWLQEIDKDVTQKYTCYVADETALKKLSGQVTPNRVTAVMPLFAHTKADLPSKNERVIALDCIQDPGNLGTIIRLADWFGIDHIVCSNDCADFYNPKVIQSTMGAFLRVKVHYTNLESYLQEARDANIPVYGAFLKGDNIYNASLYKQAIIVMGNESKGISDNIGSYVSQSITIPSFRSGDAGSESLNVAVATAIICSEFARQSML